MSETKSTQQQPKEAKQASKGSLVLILIVLAVIVVGALIWAANSNNKSNEPAPAATVPTAAAVSINDTGFTPATIKVTAGTTVTWTNSDKKPHRVASDPYPTNNGLPGFDSNIALNQKDTYSYTFDKAGVFTYHDQLNPTTFKGSVIVTAKVE